MFKSEQTTNMGLRRQLEFYESQQRSLDKEREECRRVKRKLVDLQGIETLLNGKAVTRDGFCGKFFHSFEIIIFFFVVAIMT